ncbi:hypothetical protein HQ520_17310 [bacterium]|nr:hypothetical protein [bacterium]
MVNDNTLPARYRMRALARVVLFVLLMGACAFGAGFLQNQQLKKIKVERPYRGSFFLPRAEYAKILAFGYDVFLADFLYLRSIQAFGGQWRTVVKDYKSINRFFNTITELDPQFLEAYEFGSMVIGEESGDPAAAIALNAKGRIKNPDRYRLPYWNIYISWWTLSKAREEGGLLSPRVYDEAGFAIAPLGGDYTDPLNARYWIQMTQRAKDCPEFVPRMLRYIDKETGRFQAALERWISDYLDAVRANDNFMRSIATTQFIDISDKWNLEVLHGALAQYLKDHDNQPPPDLQTLVREGYLQSYQGADFRSMVTLLDHYWDAGQVPEGAFQTVVDATFKEMSGVPASPYGADPRSAYYILRKDLVPEDYPDAMEQHFWVMSLNQARIMTNLAIGYVRNRVKSYYEKNMRYPLSLNELSGMERARDAKAGYFNYNPLTGEVKSPTYPDL